MSTQIVTLACPTCGNASNIEAKRVRFGYEFTCPFCSATSVMIVDRQLYVPKEGEIICYNCGAINPKGAKFCNCGTQLVRHCVYCREEFPADNERCTHCGRLQNIPTAAKERQALMENAVSRLKSQTPAERLQASEELRLLAPDSQKVLPAVLAALQAEKNSQVRTALLKALSAVKPDADAVPLLVTILRNDFNAEVRRAVCEALATIGADAGEAVGPLCDTLNDDSEDVNVRVQVCHALRSIGVSAPTINALQQSVRSGSSALVQRAAGEVLTQLDPSAAVDAFTDVLSSEGYEWVAREAAFDMLRDLDRLRALKVTSDLVRHPKRAERNGQTPQVMQIQYVKQDSDYEALAKLLTDLNPRTAGAIFADVLKDDHIDPQFKRIVCRLLIETPAEREHSIPVLVEWLKHKETAEIAYHTLSRMGMQAVPALKRFVGGIALGSGEQLAKTLIEEIERKG